MLFNPCPPLLPCQALHKLFPPSHPFLPVSGPEFRAKLEALEALERAMPIQDRIGGVDAWNMSLRDAWERIVPVGNMFSGLYAVIRDKPADKCVGGVAGTRGGVRTVHWLVNMMHGLCRGMDLQNGRA